MKAYHIFISALLMASTALTSFGAGPVKRTMHYFPQGKDIVCVNGEQRYTRPLYGTNTRFRLETSDRPVFVAYDRLDSWNVRFYLSFNGKEIELDETSFCEARYRGGRRSYVVRDKSWGEGTLGIVAMASFQEEAAIWAFDAEGFDGPVTLKARRCRIAAKTFYREGDMGTDPREGFEPAEGEPDLCVAEWKGNGKTFFYHSQQGPFTVLPEAEGAARFAAEEEACDKLMGQVVIDTPDPFFNTIGANMVAAADGIWDGTTFLHGANGWRTPLAGWRGAYVGDVVGWNDRAVSHFTTYSKSMVTDKPVIYPQPQQDTLRKNMAASRNEWGTPIYSNGYICRVPGNNSQMSHYDMNLNYFDELFTHFSYNADPEFLRYMWPYIVLHHQWEKRNFDPDGDHLYDAYCCIWASDALYYSGGAVTHSSAYNYRSNLLTARVAEIIGEDPTPYREEAEAILKAMNERLWLEEEGYWAEYQDYMGLKRLHKSAAVWSIYTPIDCEAGTPEQFYRATRYVDRSIPHIPIVYEYDQEALKSLGLELPAPETDLFTVSTTDWLPYVWSTNNVAHEEVANMALAYLQAGRNDSGFKLLKADILDEMYLGGCPGNFGQISFYDKSRSEAYRDFADNVGTTSRAVVNGLFGIIPDALNGKCVVKPAFPDDWDHASIKTPYLSYSFRREGTRDIYEIEQHFAQPLTILVRANAGGGAYLEVKGNSDERQTIVVDRTKMPKALKHKEVKTQKDISASKRFMAAMGLGEISRKAARRGRMVDISAHFNSNADDIFRNEYMSPRPPFTTLQLPKQGVGDWCVPTMMHEIEDDGFRSKIVDGVFDTGLGLKFLSPADGQNIVYTSLWDNYPNEVSIPLEGRAKYAYLLMAGSTQNMQSRIANAVVTVTYTDGSTSVMELENPTNWCPIDQDYYRDEYSFWTSPLHPYRVLFGNGVVDRHPNIRYGMQEENDKPGLDVSKETDRLIPDGAGQILKMPLRKGKKLRSLTLTTLSNDVVVGIMGITLEK